MLSPPETMMQASVVAGIIDRSQRHVLFTQKVPRVVQRLNRSPRDSEDREDSTTDPARSEPRGPQQTQRGQSPEGHNRPSEVRALRAKQDPAWSKAQCGQSPKRPDRPSEVRALRVCEEQTRTCATARRPECQQARVPLNQPSPVCFYRPRASRSSSRGRGVGPIFRLCAPSFSSLFCRFSVLVSRKLSRSRRCAVATPAIRGVSRSG